MKYTFEEYKAQFFDGSSEKMMDYWDKLPQIATRWKQDYFYVVDGDHVRAPVKNVVQFEEGVK